MMAKKPNADPHERGPLARKSGRLLPPMALVSLNVAGTLIAQAEEYEQFAATENSLSETGGRDKFWRASAAMRLVAQLIADDPGIVAAYCATIHRARAQS